MSTSVIDADAAAPAPNPMRLTRNELALIVGFWAVFAALSIASRLLDRSGTAQLSGIVSIALIEALCWTIITPPIVVLAGRLDVERGRKAQLVVLVVTGLAIAIILGWAGAELRRSLTPFGGPPGVNTAARGAVAAARDSLLSRLSPRGSRGPPIWFGVLNALVLYFGVVAAALARSYSRRYQLRREEAARREARLEAQLAEARLDALRRQLDPHFLFNTLNTVSALVERDPRGVRRMITRLSELLRHSFEGGGEAEVPLRDELALLTRYIDIMQVRFQGRLTVETRADDDVLDALVPTMILQPLVENAIKHGIERIAGPGIIRISAERENGKDGGPAELVLRVHDNGPGLSEGSAGGRAGAGGVGLRNSIARLEQLYGTAQCFRLAPDARGGSVVEVRLPYHLERGGRAHGG